MEAKELLILDAFDKLVGQIDISDINWDEIEEIEEVQDGDNIVGVLSDNTLRVLLTLLKVSAEIELMAENISLQEIRKKMHKDVPSDGDFQDFITKCTTEEKIKAIFALMLELEVQKFIMNEGFEGSVSAVVRKGGYVAVNDSFEEMAQAFIEQMFTGYSINPESDFFF